MPCPNNMMGRIVYLFHSDVKLAKQEAVGGIRRGYAYQGLRLLSREERYGQQLNVPEFCDWNVEGGNFKIRIPRTDVCDGETVYFEYCVHGETGKMTLWVRNIEIDIEKIGFSRHVILDQFWINSVIRIADVAKLCKGYMEYSEYMSKRQWTAALLTHKWNTLLGAETDAISSVHHNDCTVIKNFTGNYDHKICLACIRGMGRVIRSPEAAHQKCPPKTKKKKRRKRKVKYSDHYNSCDCLKSKRSRGRKESSNEISDAAAPQVETPKNSSCGIIIPKLEAPECQPSSSCTFTGDDQNTITTRDEWIKKELKKEDISEKVTTFPETCNGSDGNLEDNSFVESKTCIPDIKVEIQDDTMVYNQQGSVLTVCTIPQDHFIEPSNNETACASLLCTNQTMPRLPAAPVCQSDSLKQGSDSSKKYECTECNMTFRNNGEVEIHTGLCHDSGDERTGIILPKCPFCNITHVEAETHYRTKHNIIFTSSVDVENIKACFKSEERMCYLRRCELCGMRDTDARTHYSMQHNIINRSLVTTSQDQVIKSESAQLVDVAQTKPVVMHSILKPIKTEAEDALPNMQKDSPNKVANASQSPARTPTTVLQSGFQLGTKVLSTAQSVQEAQTHPKMASVEKSILHDDVTKEVNNLSVIHV